MTNRIPAGLASLALMAASCRRDGRPEAARAGADEATSTYGYGPDPNGSVVYQPDVIVVRGGPKAIRAASADGLAWTIDGRAGGADALRPGKIMFATSRAVGRVLDLDRRGKDLVVRVTPVRLTEVVKDARIRVDLPMDRASVVYQSVPELPGMVTESSAALALGPPGLRNFWLASAPARSPLPDLPTARKNSVKVKLGVWEVEPYLTQPNNGQDQSGTIGLKLQRTEPGLKFGADVNLFTRNLKVRASVPIANGAIDGSSSFLINGIEEIRLGLFGGAEHGVADNVKVRMEVPVELIFQIPPGPETAGLPLTVQIKFKWIVITAFSGNNSTLKADGSYGLSGAIGYENGAVVSPKFEVREPIMKSLGGVTVGASGVVLAWETRFLVGLGTPQAMAGPYAKAVVSVGVTRGSVLGSPLATCTGVTLKVDVGGGAGVQLETPITNALQNLLGRPFKTEFEMAERMANVVNKRAVAQDVPLCRGTAFARRPAGYYVVDRDGRRYNGLHARPPSRASMTEREPATGPETDLLIAAGAGDRQALDQMLPLVYAELHRLATGYLSRERPDHTLQATALVNEAYLRLINQRRVDWRNRAQFLGLAANMMRRILVNHARDRAVAKRGGGQERVSLGFAEVAADRGNVDLIELEDALDRLGAQDPRKARVVELRFFGGLSMDEIAEVLGVSKATVERDWTFARAWLYDAIRDQV